MTHDSKLHGSPQAYSSMSLTRISSSLNRISTLHRALLRKNALLHVATYLCLGLLFIGCTSKTKTEETIELQEPQVINGEIVDPNDEGQLAKMAEDLDAIELPSETALKTEAPPRLTAAEAAEMAAQQNLPPDAAKLITLPKLSRTEVIEILEHVIMQLQAELGYSRTAATVTDTLPNPPTRFVDAIAVARSAETGTYVIRFGYRHYATQPPQLWMMGVIAADDGSLTPNPDLAQVEPKVTAAIKTLNEMRAGLTIRDLETKLIQLSYVEPKAALGMLKGMGVTTVDNPSAIPGKVEFAKLPYVVMVQDPAESYTGLVGSEAAAAARGKLSMTPGVASKLADNAVASPMTQLLVLFHPAHPEQFSEVRHLLDTLIDRPARQIFIEAMVLEITEDGLRDLGVEWEFADGGITASAGSLLPGGDRTAEGTETVSIFSPLTSPLNDGIYDWDNWAVSIRALVRSGKAEILSRPSILTLNNRQSTIRVGQDIPIATSLQGSYGSKVSFNFDYLPTGILLNIRPRINETGKEVSMLVDTVVSAKVPGEDLELRDTGTDAVLASAPTVSTRRVQTYARIANNTPLIIGGLVAKEDILTQDKIPLLGDLPLIGMAFRGEKKEKSKTEVIIVLTPNVLPSKEELRRSLPKDEDRFDNFGNELFRDSYRIRGEDVFDLSFLLENARVASYREKARRVAEKNFRLGEQEPFRSFVRDSVPGESILVTRMIYEVIKRLNVAELVDPTRLIYFDSQQVGGYNVEFLNELLDKMGGRNLKNFEDKALALTYQYDRNSLEEGRLGTEPVPTIKLVACPDRDTWGKLLWELNQPTEDGRQRHTILIQNEGDILRLRRALALKRIATLNGGEDQMRLRNFSVGKVLLMPQLKKGQIHVIDADAARFFFHTEHYYAATLAQIEEQLTELDMLLSRPDISILLGSDLIDDDLSGGPQ